VGDEMFEKEMKEMYVKWNEEKCSESVCGM